MRQFKESELSRTLDLMGGFMGDFIALWILMTEYSIRSLFHISRPKFSVFWRIDINHLISPIMLTPIYGISPSGLTPCYPQN